MKRELLMYFRSKERCETGMDAAKLYKCGEEFIVWYKYNTMEEPTEYFYNRKEAAMLMYYKILMFILS